MDCNIATPTAHASILRQLSGSACTISLRMAGAAINIDLALLHHQLDPLALLQYPDIGERIAIDRDDVGKLAGLQRAEILVQLERFRGVARGGEDRVHRLHAEPAIGLQLEGVAAHAGLKAHVGAHRDIDARLVELLERLEADGLDRFHLIERELRRADILADGDGMIGAVRQSRRHPHFRFEDFFQRIYRHGTPCARWCRSRPSAPCGGRPA